MKGIYKYIVDYLSLKKMISHFKGCELSFSYRCEFLPVDVYLSKRVSFRFIGYII